MKKESKKVQEYLLRIQTRGQKGSLFFVCQEDLVFGLVLDRRVHFCYHIRALLV